MSKLFFDHLLDFSDLELLIKENSIVNEEREELWKLIDEIVHHNAMGCIFEHLPEHHHITFVEKLKTKPHDEEIIIFLKEKGNADIENLLKSELQRTVAEILKDLTS